MTTPDILLLNQVSTFLGLSPNSILKKVKSGDFPQPVLVGGPNSWVLGWLYEDLIAYKTTYIDPFRDLRRGPDSAKAGSDQGSVVNGYPSTRLLRGDSDFSSRVWNAGSEHRGTLTPQGGTNGRRQSETERPERLTEAFARAIQAPGRYGNGRGGLGVSLLVKPTTIEGLMSKTWSQRVRINGRETNVGLGSYPEVTLEEALQRAKRNCQAIKQGRDPRINATLTFRETYAKMLEGRVEGLEPSDSPAEWAASFRRHVDPILGDLNTEEISGQHIMVCLAPIWFDKRVTAKKLLRRIRKVMRWAMAHGYIDSDPTEYVQDGLGPNPSRPKHRKSLPPDEVRPAIKVIDASGSGWAVKAAVKFLIATGMRSKEVRGLMWDEIDYFKAICSIPGSRRKSRQDFDFPISWAVFVVLDEALQRTGGVGLVFPSPRGKDKMLSDEALRYVLRANRIPCTPHGFRTSLKVYAKEKGWPDEIAEAALGHALPPRVRAYLRGHPPELRRPLMDAWATHAGFYSPPILTPLDSPLPTYTATNPFTEADSSTLYELGELAREGC